MGQHPDSYRKATKAITDAPNLRDTMAQQCSGCAFYKRIEGTGDGVCEKYEFQPAPYYVCDAFELPAAPDVAEQVVEALVEAAAEVPMAEMYADTGKAMVAYGGELKALGNGKVSGYLVRYTAKGDYDLTLDRFDANTDTGIHDSVPVFYHHGLDTVMGKRILAKASLTRDPFGVWAETQLSLRDEYEKFIYQQTEAGKMGWSSGVPAHLIERQPEGKGALIKMWHIAEASITPTPAEPRNTVVSLKSLQNIPLTANPEAEAEAGVTTPAPQATVTASDAVNLTQIVGQPTKENQQMEGTEFKSIVTDALAPIAERLGKVENALKAEPPLNGNGTTNITVISDPADRPFKSIAAQLFAVKHYTLTKQDSEYPRLKGLKHLEMENLKATGASEAIPGDGGFLLEPTLTKEILAPMHEVSQFTAGVTPMTVSTNSNSGTIPGVDETSRVDGSRWGGIRAYWLAEGGTKVASRPTFREITWKLKKIAVLSVATDELLQDATQYSQILRQGAGEELAFKVNDAVFEGNGVSQPLGVMNSPALITVARTTGSKILGDDISALWNRMDPRSRARATWYIGNDSQPQLDNLFAVGSTAVLYPYASIQNGIQTLYGRPVVVTEYNQTLNTTGDILLADMSQYYLWSKGDTQEETSMHVYFTTDETAFRFVYRVDGLPVANSAITPFHGSTTTSPFVVLGSAT